MRIFNDGGGSDRYWHLNLGRPYPAHRCWRISSRAIFMLSAFFGIIPSST